MTSETKVFRSAVSWWLFGPVLALQLGLLFDALMRGVPWPAALALVGSLVVVGSLLITTRYTLTADALLVRSSIFRWRVPLATIERVYPTRNPLSSPALSLNRLAIRYGRFGYLLISPEDRAAFVGALLARNPAIRVNPPLA